MSAQPVASLTAERVRRAVRDVVRERTGRNLKISGETRLHEDCGCNWMDLVIILSAIEDDLAVQIPEDDRIDQLTTVGQLETLAAEALSTKEKRTAA